MKSTVVQSKFDEPRPAHLNLDVSARETFSHKALTLQIPRENAFMWYYFLGFLKVDSERLNFAPR
jgi:hypothetical protein